MTQAPNTRLAMCVLLAALSIASCERRSELTVPWPPPAAIAARASLLFAVEAHEELAVTAIDARRVVDRITIEVPAISPAEIEAGGTVRLTAFAVAADLASLRLGEGPVSSVAAVGSIALVDSSTVILQTVARSFEEIPAWGSAVEISPTLRAFRVGDPTPPGQPCQEFEPRTISFAGDIEFWAMKMIRHDSDSALAEVYLDGSRYWRITRGAAEMLEGPEPRLGRHHGGFTAPDRSIWLGGADGALDQLRVVGSRIERIASLRSPRSSAAILALDGSGEGAPFEIFMVRADRSIERFDGAVWSTLWRADSGPTGGTFPADIAWVSPGVAAAAVGSVLVHVRGSTASASTPGIGPALTGEYGAVERLPSGDVIAGGYASGGFFVRYDEAIDGWRLLADPDANLQRVGAIAPTASGFLYGGTNQQLGEYIERESLFCPPIQLGITGRWDVFAPLGGGEFLIGGVHARTTGPSVIWLVPL